MMKWTKSLFGCSIDTPVYGDTLDNANIIEEGKFVPTPPPIVFEYKVYLRDAGKSVTINATRCTAYNTIYAFYYGDRTVGLFEKDVVKYIKADIPEELLNEV